MAKEVIVINEPDEIAKDFEEGTLLNVEGKVLRVKNDTRNESGCNVCALDAEELGEYCACAFCGDCHFIEIESHERVIFSRMPCRWSCLQDFGRLVQVADR